MKVVDDQWMTPTYTADAADAILDLALGNGSGVVHVTNQGVCTWYAFASAAIRGATSSKASATSLVTAS